MSNTIFNYEDFHKLIEEFSSEVPVLLKGNALTADLAARIENLLDVTESPFTLAVVGQMRSGKSTLLNSLIGEDLAVTGVNETTATINWFKYAPKDECDKFRVVWKNKPAENLLMEQIDEWVGNSEKAADTRFLEFFSDAEYLKHANIVDTPGTKSVIASHEETIQEFLSMKHDKDTKEQGGKADAILYVLMPVARQADSDMLADFDKDTRLPGSSPYNSIAVVHKWEMLEAEDPFDEVINKVQRIEKSMKDKVAAVLPFSAPMAIAVTRFDNFFWEQLASLLKEMNHDDLDDMVVDESYFFDDEECPLSVDERKALIKKYPLPWRTLYVIIKTAMNRKITEPEKLKEHVLNMSGLETFKEELNKRFFSRSKMIKMFSVLSKAWDPCNLAQARFRASKITLGENLENTEKILEILQNRIKSGDIPLQTVLDYVKDSGVSLTESFHRNSNTLKKIGDAAIKIKDAFDDMNNDIQMLDILDEQEDKIDNNLLDSLKSILGFYGADMESRLKRLTGNESQIDIELVETKLGELSNMQFSYKGDIGKVISHAISRLEQMADILEQQVEEQ